MPRLSDQMEEGTVLRWAKEIGDDVARGDELFEIETDAVELPLVISKTTPLEDRVDAERRHERRDGEHRDGKSADEACHGAGDQDQADRLGHQARVAVRHLRDEDRRQRDHPGNREIEPALLDHERLFDSRDREDCGERQHRQERRV